MGEAAVVEVEQVSKKFCRQLRSSLWYGVLDVAYELAARDRGGDLSLRRGEFLAVDDVSFQLRPGECVGLIGRNGAGKSTLLKMLNGLVRPDKGRICMHGRVGALIELGAGFSPVLTGRENIYVNGAVLGFSKSEIDAKLEAIIDFAELKDAIDAPVQTYSSGMYVRLGFAVAAQLDPDVMLIDEILAVGDLAFQVKCMNRIWSLLKSGVAIILVTHQLYHVHAFANRAILMEAGRIVYEGDPALATGEYERRVAADAVQPSRPDVAGPLRFGNVSLQGGGAESSGGDDGWTVLETYRPFRIVVQYDLAEPVDDGVQIGLLIKNLQGHRVAGFTTKPDGIILPGLPGRYAVTIDFPENLLLNGQYYCSLSAFDSGYKRSLGHWEVAARFHVRTPGFSALGNVGSVLLPHRISVTQVKV